MIADVSDAARERLPGAEGTDAVMARLRAGDVRALARAISAVEDGTEGAKELLAACSAIGGEQALRIGVTGPPGAGKSTLVDRLVRGFRAQGKTVGVIAVDPSSPYTGGALLGDRIRMQDYAGDEGVYLRSMASRGATGGLAVSVADACVVMEAAGREIVLVETVGAGQDEVEIASLGDVTLVVLVPGMGDDVQSLKAGMMEIADIFVVNKADREGAERMEAEIRAMQSLGETHAGGVPPVVRTVATTGEGVEELIGQIAMLRGRTRREVRSLDAGRRRGSEVRLDHVGIAVRSIAAARGFYGALGLTVGGEEVIEQEQVKAAMLVLGETQLELLEATAEDSTIGRFLAKRGEGVHHLAMRVGDIDAMFERLRSGGVRLVSDCIGTGAGGHRYFFIHPRSTGGVLIEIVGDADGASGEASQRGARA